MYVFLSFFLAEHKIKDSKECWSPNHVGFIGFHFMDQKKKRDKKRHFLLYSTENSQSFGGHNFGCPYIATWLIIVLTTVNFFKPI